MARASPSGKGGMGQVLVQLDVVHMKQIKSIIRQWARDRSKMEFEAIWPKCVSSISKACQNLRNGRLSKTFLTCTILATHTHFIISINFV